MYVIGITGGVGTGKSTILDMLKDNYNCVIIKTDDIGRMLMEPGQKAYEQVVALFSEDILLSDKTIDRKKLADIVFNNANKLMVLNSIVHPLVKKYITEEIGYCKAKDNIEFVFIESALLLEDHYNVICDDFWYIYSDENIRRERLKESRGYSDEKIDSVIMNQLDEEAFKKQCRFMINNNDSLNDTKEQIDRIINEEYRRK